MNVLSKAERSNFLRQCWRTGHWSDGVGTLVLPLRMSLYGLRKKIRKPAKSAAKTTSRANENQLCPQFSAKIHRIFCDATAQREPAPQVELSDLFADVDAQLSGVYRLAGGRSLKLDVANIDSLADQEDHHAYHRLYWALRYAVAACFGHQGAAEGLTRDLSQWLDSNWENSAVAMWPYTLAERIGSLTAILFWIDRGNNQQLSSLIIPIKRQIWRDAVRLSSNIEYGLGVHNHLLNDARGLYLASAALADCGQAKDWQSQAFQIWDEYFPKLILEDGALAEQSSHYHLLLCRTALEYALACRRAGHSIPPQFENRLAAMFCLANELLRPDGSLPRFGDNSPDRTGTDLWGFLAAAYHFGLLAEPPRHRAITPLTIFYCGIAPQLPAQSPEQKPARKSVLFPDGGFAILHSPNQPLTAELAAHGHADTLPIAGTHGDTGSGSFELWWNNRILIREPGCFYSNTDSRSRLYHSAQCQNVTSLNGLAPLISKHDARFLAPWYLHAGVAAAPAAAASAAAQWKAFSIASAEFRCDAFRRIDPSILLLRRWRFEPAPEQAGALTLEERIEGASRIRVQFASRICLGDAPWTVAHAEARTASRAAEPCAQHLVYTADDGSSAEMTISAPAGISLSIEPCTFLPDYGVEKPGRVILLSGYQQLPFSWSIRWKLTPSLKALAALKALESLDAAEAFAQVKRS
jgi:hypothetical protein